MNVQAGHDHVLLSELSFTLISVHSLNKGLLIINSLLLSLSLLLFNNLDVFSPFIS